MSVKHLPTVNEYVRQHAAITMALENLQEFVNSMPAPDENGHLPSVDYGYTGSTTCLYELLTEAMRIADAMSK